MRWGGSSVIYPSYVISNKTRQLLQNRTLREITQIGWVETDQQLYVRLNRPTIPYFSSNI